MKTKPDLLPAAVTQYLAAVNRHDADAAAECFAADASVHDENRQHNGRDAIRAWVAETSLKYQSTLTLLRETVSGDDVHLSVAVSGQFPGSPVTLAFKMRMQRGKIAALTIG